MKRDPLRLVEGGGRELGAGSASSDLAVSQLARDLQIARRAAPDYDAEAGLRRFSATLAGVGVAAGGLVEGGASLGSSSATTASLGSTSSSAATSGVASVGGASVAPGAAAAVPLAGGAVSTVAAAPAFLTAKILVVSMVAAGSVTGAVVVSRSSSPPPPPSSRAAPVDPPAPSSVAAPAPSPERADRVAPAVAPPTEALAATSAAPGSAPGAAPAARPAAASSSSAAAPVKPEMEHLALVRQAGDPATALARAEEGHARFPRGVFWQEREAIAIASLVRVGRAGEARARSQAFLARHPESPYAAQLRRIAGDPAPP